MPKRQPGRSWKNASPYLRGDKRRCFYWSGSQLPASLLCRGDPRDRPCSVGGANTRFAPTVDRGHIRVRAVGEHQANEGGTHHEAEKGLAILYPLSPAPCASHASRGDTAGPSLGTTRAGRHLYGRQYSRCRGRRPGRWHLCHGRQGLYLARRYLGNQCPSRGGHYYSSRRHVHPRHSRSL
jgi:hypothetical protein